MKLQIPAQHVELTGKVQRCLLIAEQHGFSIGDIELGVSQTRTFRLLSDDMNVEFALTSALKPVERATHILKFVLDYDSQPSLFDATNLLVEKPSVIFIGSFHENQAVDIWRCGDEIRSQTASDKQKDLRDEGKGTHSTLESHLAWLITSLCLGFPIEDALVLARASISVKADSDIYDVSRETWPVDFSTFPVPALMPSKLNAELKPSQADTLHQSQPISPVAFKALRKDSLGLYPVVSNAEWIEKLLLLGIKTIQLRVKDPSTADLEEQIVQAIRLGEKYQAQVFINDYWELAIKHGAFGVHLGQEDIETADLQKIATSGMCLGVSTHGYHELLRISQLSPSYIALGHIFPTTTKQMPSKPQGLTRLKLYQGLINQMNDHSQESGIPTVAIGGIDLSTASMVWSCGVSSLAVVRAITLSTNPRETIADFNNIMNAYQERTEEVLC